MIEEERYGGGGARPGGCSYPAARPFPLPSSSTVAPLLVLSLRQLHSVPSCGSISSENSLDRSRRRISEVKIKIDKIKVYG